VQTGRIDERVDAVSNAREAIMELLAALNIERCGELARNLRSLYSYILAELVDVARRPDGGRLETIISMITELRTAFETVGVDVVSSPAA
jgi:flagellar protein FliS